MTRRNSVIIFAGRQRLKTISNLNITIYDRKINQDHALEYLGITISENLSWNEYIENLMSKINQRLGILRRVKPLLPLNARLAFYTATILPLFDYADIIWGDKNNTGLMNGLQTLENKAAKLILDLPPVSLQRPKPSLPFNGYLFPPADINIAVSSSTNVLMDCSILTLN